MTYQEYIYKLCKDVDMKDQEKATQLAQTLATIALEYISTAIKQDKKLKEIMSAKDYEEWTDQAAKELFRESTERMEDEEFREFCLEHFDEIVGDK